jgi:hypothetical protein
MNSEPKNLSSYHFYLLRLRTSSFQELIYRAKQFFLVKKLHKKLKSKKEPVQAPAINPKDIVNLQSPTLEGSVEKTQIDEILKGEVFCLNTPPWAVNAFERKTRYLFFAHIKPGEEDPDIRAVWEPARLQHITTLFYHSRCNGEAKDAEEIKIFAQNAVKKWIRENPFLRGPHYMSAMECGLRIPVFFDCLKNLDNPNSEKYDLLLNTVYQHGWWISKRLSLYSSRGNHTVCEAVGLIFAGSIFRNTPGGRAWLITGYELLNRELDHQILGDGGPAEQSLNYHRFVLDLYWLAIDFLEKNHPLNVEHLKNRLIKAEHFLSAFANTCGGLPAIGDSDDGYAVAPNLYPKRISPEKNSAKRQTFSTSGYTVVNEKGAVLTFDHGGLGMAPFYNHGHADALSITLSLNGKAMLVDPGTFTYNGDTRFRRYFKGTRAHNTVTIDGLDQAVQETRFIWSSPYETFLEKSEEKEGTVYLRASHNGYGKLKKPVMHRRSVRCFGEAGLLVEDTFLGQGKHAFELNYHLHPHAACEEQDGWFAVENQDEKIFLKLMGKHMFRFAAGEEGPLFGWYSPAYGIKMKSGVLSCRVEGTPQEASFLTAIGFERPLDETFIKGKEALL